MIYSFSTFGYEGSLINIESDVRRGIPSIDIVGLADSQVIESRERVRTAFLNSGIDFPSERLLISLSPADIRKEGANFDLPLCCSVICANEQKELPHTTLIMGEVELSGNIRAVKGIYASVQTAVNSGISYFIIPSGNFEEVSQIKGIRVLKADSLKQVYSQMFEESNYVTTEKTDNRAIEETDETEINGIYFSNENNYYPTLENMNPRLLKALAIAISGHHHLIGYGTVGNGKTMAAQFAQCLLPRLTFEESDPVTRIQSLSGLIGPSHPYVKYPPYRMPHQTATIEGICGGGINCRPGEISLAHNGILFFDEMAEFRTSVIQMLRVPMESKYITLSRAGRTTTYPSDFTFIGMTLPCPCGNFGSKDKICLCSAKSIEMYWRKFSAPLLDRCILINTDRLNDKEMKNYYTTESLRRFVANATVIQRKHGKYNGNLTPNELADRISLVPQEVKDYAEKVTADYSNRRIELLWKVALTVANINNRENITIEDIQESHELTKSVDLVELAQQTA